MTRTTAKELLNKNAELIKQAYVCREVGAYTRYNKLMTQIKSNQARVEAHHAYWGK